MTGDYLTKDILDFFKVPDPIAKLANNANTDLYHGPLYLDGEGNICSMFDQVEGGVTAFNFSEACRTISDWCGDNVADMYYDVDCGALLSKEPQGDEDEDGNWIEPLPCCEISRKEIIQTLFGTELASHL